MPGVTVCLNCSSPLVPRLQPWLRFCRACGLWTSLLGQDDPGCHPGDALDESRRESGLKPLRLFNFEKILNVLGRYMTLRDARVADVGCAYGWFLEAARLRGMRATGVEPEAEVAERARANGLDVRIGYFPECLGAAERFDLITFHDVLEHLPGLPKMLRACHDLLAAGGKLLINLPDSNGLLFRLACFGAGFGYTPFLERLWQKNFRFPHLYYFHRRNLAGLVERQGFRLLRSEPLSMVQVNGLWPRLRMDRMATWLGSVVTYGFIAAIYPLMNLVVPADALAQIYEKV